MLSFNSKDYNLKTICGRLREGLSYFKIKNYYIYGIKIVEKRPHIVISGCVIPLELKNLFEQSNIKIGEGTYKKKGIEITIGLRKDVRDDVKLSKNLIKTIIFAIENKLVIELLKIKHSLSD